MSTTDLLRRCHALAGLGPETELEPDSLVGFFQMFRPDGSALEDLFADLKEGESLHARLQQLYAAAGDDRRPAGGRDAYFVVRHPRPMDPKLAEQLGADWLAGLLEIARMAEDLEVAALLDSRPRIRVLEGIPPKHPRDEAEKSRLLKAIQSFATLIEQIEAPAYAATLRPAYYFTACDSMLRDYLMWPIYAESTGLKDPLLPYFQLWSHGVKYRIFGESQIDLYLPRHAD